MDEIIEDSRALTEILEDLLIAADPRAAADRTPVDLVAVAGAAVKAQQAEAERRGINLIHTGSGSPVTVLGARVSISRLYTALISNALDHARTSVTVDVATRGQHAEVQVTDDGPGFPIGMDEQAFERFASRRPPGDGDLPQRHYGLGLALVAEVAHRHGGGVSIGQSGQGTGATVRVRLPRMR